MVNQCFANANVVFVGVVGGSSDGRAGPQLPRDRGDLRGVLERHGGQSGSERFRWIGESFGNTSGKKKTEFRIIILKCFKGPESFYD